MQETKNARQFSVLLLAYQSTTWLFFSFLFYTRVNRYVCQWPCRYEHGQIGPMANTMPAALSKTKPLGEGTILNTKLHCQFVVNHFWTSISGVCQYCQKRQICPSSLQARQSCEETDKKSSSAMVVHRNRQRLAGNSGSHSLSTLFSLMGKRR